MASRTVSCPVIGIGRVPGPPPGRSSSCCCIVVTSTKTRSVFLSLLGGTSPSTSAFIVAVRQAEDLVREELAQVQDDLLLGLRDRQPGHVDLAVEAQRDLAVGADQPLARDRPARQGFQHLDDEHVRRLDRRSSPGHGGRAGLSSARRRSRVRPAGPSADRPAGPGLPTASADSGPTCGAATITPAAPIPMNDRPIAIVFNFIINILLRCALNQDRDGRRRGAGRGGTSARRNVRDRLDHASRPSHRARWPGWA